MNYARTYFGIVKKKDFLKSDFAKAVATTPLFKLQTNYNSGSNLKKISLNAFFHLKHNVNSHTFCSI